MATPVGITLLGCGIVGSGVIRILNEQRELLQRRTGLVFDVRHVVVRDLEKHKAQSSILPFTTDVDAAINDPRVTMVVETMGGVEEANAYVEKALRIGTPIVTANKSLLASRGPELFALARANDTCIAFEASCGGGIPIINALSPEDHQEIYGTDKSINITLATTDKMIEKDSDKVDRVVRALDKADQWIASHSPEQVADAIAPVAPGLDRELLVSAVKDTMVTAPKSTDISKTAYESSAKVLEESEIIQSVPPLDEPFSCEFAVCTG